ncbi:MAG: citramalate synthase [Chloroflexi bacterium]|nr:citramalate synthase [Chloroflexota bacterium]
MAPRVVLYDTTLRDGAQREGISFSVEDKLKVAARLDELGIDFIEGGWPGANPKDTEFFARARSLQLTHGALVAFGSTRKAGASPDADPNLTALLSAGTKTVTLVGKAWDLQVTQVLETTLDENVRMVTDSIGYLRSQGLAVFFDAEHYFDGFRANPGYAATVVEAAAEAGAECVILCDTNGGSLPGHIVAGVEAARRVCGAPLGIHAHNDCELAVANTLAAVQAGVVQVQGTLNGYGERCGNANLCSVIPDLKLKMGINCVSDRQLARLTEASRYVSELANMVPDSHLPYVGVSAFTHKAGLHVSGVMKCQESYQHVDPALVGNGARVVVSELSGRQNIVYKAREMGLAMPPDPQQTQRMLERIKDLESRGFQYDGAEASFELLLRRAQPGYRSPFELVDFMVVVETRRRPSTGSHGGDVLAEATVKVRVGSKVMHTAAEGDGPVNALDRALRKALVEFYPSLTAVKLVDYKVRILDESSGTGSFVRVLIESSDGEGQWHTVGSSANIIEASWLALADSIEYWLLKQRESGKVA